MESFVFLCFLVLFVGNLSTAVTFIYCGTKRYSELWRSGKWIFESLYARRVLIAVLFLFISWTVSTFGKTSAHFCRFVLLKAGILNKMTGSGSAARHEMKFLT